MWYYIEIRESDGNDCTVYDAVIEANNRDDADYIVSRHFDALAEEKNWDSDGDSGYYFPCDCEAPEEPTDDPAECDQCNVMRINGVLCHETGCPTFAKYKRDRRAYELFEDRDCSHGGLTISEPEEFETEDQAEERCCDYHSTYEIDVPDMIGCAYDPDLDAFTLAYVEAALWSSTDDECEPLDRNYSRDDIADECMVRMVADCAKFQRDNEELITEGNCLSGRYPAIERAGHDFWLTRNGHGCGFWEQDDWAQVAGESLTRSAHAFGEVNLYVYGGLIYAY